MNLSVGEAAQRLEERGVLRRDPDDRSLDAAEYVGSVLRRDLPTDLVDFYRERIASVCEFSAVIPHWKQQRGWRPPREFLTCLLHADAAPLFGDGCGNLFGLDLATPSQHPAVYFFDRESEFAKPEYAAGSSIARFLLLLADTDRALRDGWPAKWQLAIDPDLETCPRAPPIWDSQ